jgi:hypothetical protein
MIPFFMAESNKIADIALGINPLGSLVSKASANSRNVDFGSVQSARQAQFCAFSSSIVSIIVRPTTSRLC